MNEWDFDEARRRLEEIAERVKDKNIDLEESVGLLEEGVRLANCCAERLAEAQVIDEVDVEIDAPADETESGE